MAARIPPRDSDTGKRLRLLHAIVDALGTQAKAAEVIGVEPSTISQWLSGKREVEGWHVLHEALRRTIVRRPDAAPALIETFAGEVLDQAGRWVPEDEEPAGSWAEESADVVVTLGDLHQANRRGDRAECHRLARELEREAREAGRAALGGRPGASVAELALERRTA